MKINSGSRVGWATDFSLPTMLASRKLTYFWVKVKPQNINRRCGELRTLPHLTTQNEPDINTLLTRVSNHYYTNHLKIMSNTFAHCLRPLFTENLLKDLQAGISLNLVGDSGQGRWRLLEDLQKCALENTIILAVNMRSYKQSYDGFVSALWQSLGETAGGGDLGNLLTALEKRQQQVIFWLHDIVLFEKIVEFFTELVKRRPK
jgi:hypothetical protein